ncbi:hypothetical protein E2562_016549 [Oryza meyeriana var. granulata]|uniref:DUF1618 domain-containing protein n=1 Tax=Oryza meyeriana var. granulata TaxID=110450 RepID=A0A6G1C6N5_9ORYZ|nr:hypothetical protein E2562_016549 [Oryza meyeriana var. granulata]
MNRLSSYTNRNTYRSFSLNDGGARKKVRAEWIPSARTYVHGNPTGAGVCPRWVILKNSGKLEDDDEDSNSCSAAAAEANTAATSLTSAGHPFRVSFRLEAPPAASRLRFRCFACTDRRPVPCMRVVAAHRDAVLVVLGYQERFSSRYVHDYFVYNAGAGAADPPRPPSLSLLPPYHRLTLHEANGETYQRRRRPWPMPHMLKEATTGLLRRGEDDLVVADLVVIKDDDLVDEDTPDEDEDEDDIVDECTSKEGELLVLRSGEWSITRTPIIHDDGKAGELSSWKTDMVVPVGDRQLCWVNLYRGVILCDLSDETPKLRYLSLPVKPPDGKFDDDRYGDNPRGCPTMDRTVCVTNGGAVLKFIDIFPRCCCGSPGATLCDHSIGAFVVNTWTLGMDDDMAWTMDAMVDATELLSLDAFPRVNLEHPVMSIDDPNLICFVVPEKHKQGKMKYCFSETIWKIMVDTTSKTLVSVSRYDNSSEQQPFPGYNYLPSKIPDYFIASYGNYSNGATKSPAIVDRPQVATKIVV